jgi:predicted CXXCH cytochrome family protein
VILLPIEYGHGHPVEKHPVTDVIDPTNVNKVVKSINCLTCHQPHSGSYPGMLVKDQQNNMAFCMTCHGNMAPAPPPGPQPQTPQPQTPQPQAPQPQAPQPQGEKTK